MINRLMVANRGEIARRVFRTCRDLGIETVAVFSDADARMPFVREADAAVRLAGDSPGETYLRGELIVKAAIDAGADAIHPGYGFLAESAAFAREVATAGLTWVGPPAEAIETMGAKVTAKRLMAASDVPVLAELDPSAVTEADLPLLVKAAAGGGGRGMRVVSTLGELAAQLAAARSEAGSAFGDSTVFCEPYLAAARHIEVQLLADQHGAVWALGERECSLQRRYQKVLEETPSPMVDAAMRTRFAAAATAAARAVGYVGAGTVEFLAFPDGRFFFLEMNTRLQVEHPVTECVTGLDLVRLQLLVAEGAALPPDPPPVTGYAIEARLYAEDPADGWRPQGGPVHRFTVPGVGAEFGVPATFGVRLDAGVEDGSLISVHYDPLLAKVVAWAPSRADAARRLASTLASAQIHGPTTNRDLLVRALRHPAFLAGETHTAFFDRHGLETLAEPLAGPAAQGLSALAAALADAAANRAVARVCGNLPSGWRNVPSQPQRKSYETRTARYDVAYRLTRDGLVAESHDGVRLVSATPELVVLDVGGVRRAFQVAVYPGLTCVDSMLGAVALRPVDRFPRPARQTAAGSLLAPMPGTVVAVQVAEGDVVYAGQPLLVLEAMKMHHQVTAPEPGVVRALPAQRGAQVDAGALLAVVAPAEED